jgi:hypothetical protein
MMRIMGLMKLVPARRLNWVRVKAALKQNVYEWLEVDCRKYCNFSELLDNKDWKESRSIVKIHHCVLDTTRK